MDRTDLGQVNELNNEKNDLRQALDNFALGGRIVRMVISPVEVTIDTTNLSYPQQMQDAITTELQRRMDEIEEKLTELGVTVT